MHLILRMDESEPVTPVARIAREKGCRAAFEALFTRVPGLQPFLAVNERFAGVLEEAGTDLRIMWDRCTDVGAMVSLASCAGGTPKAVTSAMVSALDTLVEHYCRTEDDRKAIEQLREAARVFEGSKDGLFRAEVPTGALSRTGAEFSRVYGLATCARLAPDCSSPDVCPLTAEGHTRQAYDMLARSMGRWTPLLVAYAHDSGVAALYKAGAMTPVDMDRYAGDEMDRLARAFGRAWPVELFEVTTWAPSKSGLQ